MTEGTRPIRRKPPAAGRGGTAEAAAGAVAPETPAQQNIVRPFFTCMIIGAAFCTLGLSSDPLIRSIGLLMPVIATISYPIWGLLAGKATRPMVREKFADNCYYLGFIFTQAALLFAFLPVTFGIRPVTSQDVLGFFGMAVGASLAGLIARTIIVQTGTTIPEADDAIYNEVEQLAHQVSRSAHNILDSFDQLGQSIVGLSTKAAENIDERISSICGIIRDYDTALRAEVAAVHAASAAVVGSSQSVAASFKEDEDSFARRVAEANEAIKQLAANVTGQVSEILAVMKSGTGALSAAAADLGRMSDMGEDIGRMRANVDLIETEIGAIQTTAQSASAALTRSVDEAAGAIRGAAADGSGDIRRAAALSADDLRTATGETAAGLGAQSKAFSDDLNAAVSSFAAALEDFRDQLSRLRTDRDHAGTIG
jgi:hypothetical protein